MVVMMMALMTVKAVGNYADNNIEDDGDDTHKWT